MFDDDKSMDIQLIFNQHVVTQNKCLRINPMGFSAPCDDSLEIIELHPVKTFKD